MLLSGFAAHRKPLVSALFALGLAAGLLEGAFVLIVKSGLEGSFRRTWEVPLFLVSAVVTLRTLAQIAAARMEARGLSAWMGESRGKMLKSVAGRALPAHRGPWRNNLVTSLGEWLDQAGAGAGAGLRCLAALAQAAVLAPLLLLFSWKLALGALALSVPAMLAGRLKAGTLSAAGERWSESRCRLANSTESFVEGLENAAGNGRLRDSTAGLASAMDNHASRALSLETAKGVFPPALEWVFFMSLAALLLIAGEAREAGPEGLLPFGALLLLMYRPIREWARHYPIYLLGRHAWRRVRSFSESIETMPPRAPFPARGSGIAFSGVDFGYLAHTGKARVGASPALEAPGSDMPASEAKDRLLFRGLDLRLDPEEFTWMAGRNGAGKSTLLKLLAGVEFPSAGVISVPAAWPDRLRPFSYLPQRAHLDPDWEIWARVFRSENPGKWETLDRILGLTGILARSGGSLAIRGLSGGERQRLCLARAFASPAPYLLVDEPTTWLSAGDRERILWDLLEFWRGNSATGRPRGGALVSHEVFAGEFCSRTLDVRAVSAREGALG